MAHEKLRILIVDDSRIIRKAFSKILGDDYDLVEAVDGVGAWELLQNDDMICAVFTDMQMPRKDGLELLRSIREADNTSIQSLPVILVTSSEDSDDSVQAAFELGITDLVRKPFDRMILNASARAHVKPRMLVVHHAEEAKPTIDPASKLANKAYFDDSGQKAVAYTRRQQQSLVVAFLGIDNFEELRQKYPKVINAIIQKVGSYIRPMVRREDTLAYMEGGNFGLVVVSIESRDALRLLARIHEKIDNQKIQYNGDMINVVTSIGFEMMSPQNEVGFDHLVVKAAGFLSQAQGDGGNKVLSTVPAVAPEADPTLFAFANNAIGRLFVNLHQRKAMFHDVHAKKLLQSLFPILDLCAAVINVDITDLIDELKKRLGDTKQ